MFVVCPNMFYTVTLLCTLWFLDKGKAKSARAGTVLFVDVRHIYLQVDRAHREWTPHWLPREPRPTTHRGEALDFTLGGDEARAKLEEIFGLKPKYARRNYTNRSARSAFQHFYENYRDKRCRSVYAEAS